MVSLCPHVTRGRRGRSVRQPAGAGTAGQVFAKPGGVVALAWRRHVMTAYAVWMTVLIVSYFALPGQRIVTWTALGLSGVVAIVAGGCIHPPGPHDALAAAGLRESELRERPADLPGVQRCPAQASAGSVRRGRLLPGHLSVLRRRVVPVHPVAHRWPRPAEPAGCAHPDLRPRPAVLGLPDPSPGELCGPDVVAEGVLDRLPAGRRAGHRLAGPAARARRRAHLVCAANGFRHRRPARVRRLLRPDRALPSTVPQRNAGRSWLGALLRGLGSCGPAPHDGPVD